MQIIKISFSQLFVDMDDFIFDNVRIAVDDADVWPVLEKHRAEALAEEIDGLKCIAYRLHEVQELASTT